MAVHLHTALLLLGIMRETFARRKEDLEDAGDNHKSTGGLSAGAQTVVYIALASVVVLAVGILLYCITCMKGPSKRRRRVERRQEKPSTIVVRPALKKTNHHQQQYYAQRVARPVEQPVHVITDDQYETHSLTMYIPPED